MYAPEWTFSRLVFIYITLFSLLGTLLGLIIKCNLCFESKYLGLCCKQFREILEPNKSWGEIWFPNENGIVFHTFCAFFLEGGGLGRGERGTRHILKKTRHIFTLVFGFCLESTLNTTNLLPFDVLGPRSHLYIRLVFNPQPLRRRAALLLLA